jgi:hypothetical protein
LKSDVLRKRFFDTLIALLLLVLAGLPITALSDSDSTAIVTFHVTDSTRGNPIAGARVFVIDREFVCQDKYSAVTDAIGTASVAFRTQGGMFTVDAFRSGYRVGHSTLVISPKSTQRSFDVHVRLVGLQNAPLAAPQRSLDVHVLERSAIGALNRLGYATINTDLARGSRATSDASGNLRLRHNLAAGATIWMVVQGKGDVPVEAASTVGSAQGGNIIDDAEIILTPTELCGHI